MTRLLIGLAAGLAATGLAGALLFAWSGLYSVAATKEHWPPIRWFLDMAMRNSVETHALFIDAPDLNDLALIERGAAHFEHGCAPCHGAPDAPRNPVSQRMMPPPPALPERVANWKPRELYWVTRHGLRYTGMPAWPAPEREDEPWAVAAFLLRLDGMSAEEYRRLAFAEAPPAARAQLIELVGREEGALQTCARCHGRDGAGRNTGAFPRLSGQRAAYLYESLRAFASGERPSGMMQPVVAGLDEDTMRALAGHYASQTNAPRPPLPEADPALLELGRALATVGDPQAGVPACSGCHGPDNDSRYPSLDGQHAAYIGDQLRLWRTGTRADTPLSRIMAAAVRNLTEEQMRAVSLHYARIRPFQAAPDETATGESGGKS